MNWPINFLIAVLICAVVAIIFPWLMPRSWRKLIITPMVVPCAATTIWLLYEQHLKHIAPPGDPLIRIDLFLVVPLITLDWMSAAASVAFAQLRSRTEQGTDKGETL